MSKQNIFIEVIINGKKNGKKERTETDRADLITSFHLAKRTSWVI